jgi:DNA-binding NarL/FixJ family response regulator
MYGTTTVKVQLPALLKSCPRCGQRFQTTERTYLCPACKQPNRSRAQTQNKELSFREKQIIQMVCQAKVNKEIAYELHLSEGTIKEYLYKIFRKTSVKNRTDLALWGLAQGLGAGETTLSHGEQEVIIQAQAVRLAPPSML